MPRPAFAASLRTPALVAFAAACGFGSTAALAQSQPTPGAPSIPFAGRAAITNPEVTYQYGHEFVTIGDPGNIASATRLQQWPIGSTVRSGTVDSTYRIGRFEVTNAQWISFLNAALDRPANDRISGITVPGVTAFQTTPTHSGGLRLSVPAGQEMAPVGGVSWRLAAMYCNWLHNDMATNREAFLSGAYDVSTFGFVGVTFTDQLERSPGARFFIPSWDEWFKAVHYDPNRNGPGQPGYWNFANSSDTTPIPGLPPDLGGTGTANIAYGGAPSWQPWIALGAYADQQSPWGLLDTAGGRHEWTETWRQQPPSYPERYRVSDGSSGLASGDTRGADSIIGSYATLPHIGQFGTGFRVAAAIPHPSTGLVLMVSAACVFSRRRS